jgi:HK97 family phage major capsid protein
MSKQLRELQSRKSTLVKEARALTDRVAFENRDMTDDEVSGFDALRARIDAASPAIEREAALIADEARIGITSAMGPIVTDNREGDAKRGFYSLGEFMQAVYTADKPGLSLDARLLPHGIGAAAPLTFSNEAAGQDGGFLVPPQFSQEIFKLFLGEDSLLPLTDNVEISGNSMAFPKDETTPWGTNGIRAYWQGEAASGVPTKPVLGLATLRLNKLMALVPTTDELLDGANALTSYLPQKVALSIRWKANESILFGAGNGIPVGCMNAGAVVAVVKESGQQH